MLLVEQPWCSRHMRHEPSVGPPTELRLDVDRTAFEQAGSRLCWPTVHVASVRDFRVARLSQQRTCMDHSIRRRYACRAMHDRSRRKLNQPDVLGTTSHISDECGRTSMDTGARGPRSSIGATVSCGCPEDPRLADAQAGGTRGLRDSWCQSCSHWGHFGRLPEGHTQIVQVWMRK